MTTNSATTTAPPGTHRTPGRPLRLVLAAALLLVSVIAVAAAPAAANGEFRSDSDKRTIRITNKPCTISITATDGYSGPQTHVTANAQCPEMGGTFQQGRICVNGNCKEWKSASNNVLKLAWVDFVRGTLPMTVRVSIDFRCGGASNCSGTGNGSTSFSLSPPRPPTPCTPSRGSFDRTTYWTEYRSFGKYRHYTTTRHYTYTSSSCDVSRSSTVIARWKTFISYANGPR
ncbi:MAG: hypothetical protein AAGD35_06585 [Actinomycetota bacterium]